CRRRRPVPRARSGSRRCASASSAASASRWPPWCPRGRSAASTCPRWGGRPGPPIPPDARRRSSVALRRRLRECRERLHGRGLLGGLLAVTDATTVRAAGDAELRDESLGVIRAALLHQLVDGRGAEEALGQLLQARLVVAQTGRRLGRQVGREVLLDQPARRL